MILTQPTAADFETLLEGRTYPFFEDEDATWVIGLGHQDRAEFARAVNDFDTVAAGAPEDSQYTEMDVEWRYAVVYGGDEDTYVLLYHEDHVPLVASDPHSVPITLVSR